MDYKPKTIYRLEIQGAAPKYSMGYNPKRTYNSLEEARKRAAVEIYRGASVKLYESEVIWHEISL